MRAQVGAQFGGEPADGVGGLELADHVIQGGEVDAEAGSAGGDGQRDGDVCLAHPRRAEQGGVGLGEGQAGQVTHLAGVQLRLVGEVVVVERLVVGHLGDAQGVPDAAFLADGVFFFQYQVQEVQEVQVAELGGIGAADVVVQLLG